MNRRVRDSIVFPSYTNLRPKVAVKKMYWEFHKGDDDYYPSVPHGHSLDGKSLDGKYKLKLWTGEIIEVSTGKHVMTAKKRDMQALYNYPGFKEFVEECRKEYTSRNPGIALAPLPKGKIVRDIRSRKQYKGKMVISDDCFCVGLRVERVARR